MLKDRSVTEQIAHTVTYCVCDACGEEERLEGSFPVPLRWVIVRYRENSPNDLTGAEGESRLHFCPTCWASFADSFRA